MAVLLVTKQGRVSDHFWRKEKDSSVRETAPSSGDSWSGKSIPGLEQRLSTEPAPAVLNFIMTDGEPRW